MAKICIDAGHYGKYNRSPVLSTYYESDMVWKLHLMLKEELEKLGHQVITTRENQVNDLSLYNRGYKSKGCDLFLSLHSNACNTESVDRVVIIANLEDNKYDFDEISRELGDLLGKTIKEVMGVSEYRVITKKSSNDRDGNGIFDDEYYGVIHGAKAARTPGILLEHGFHTNLYCTKFLSDNNNLRKLAIAEAQCINNYFSKNEDKEETKVVNPMDYDDAKFIEIIAENVNKIRKEFGIEIASPIIAQACLESGYGKSDKAKFYNFFGLKYRKDRVKCHTGYFNASSSEQLEDGSYIPITTDWYSFDGFYNGTKGYFEFTNIDRYKNLKGIKDPKKYLELLKEDGYATSHEYVDKVYNVITKWNLTRFDKEQVVQEQPKEEPKQDRYYRVRKDWNDPKTQIGAYAILSNAKAACKDGYFVYDWNGNVIYPEQPKVEPKPQPTQKPTKTYVPGMYKVNVDELNIRSGPGTSYKVNGVIKDKGTYTIIETKNTHWGKLKSGVGWISIHENYCTKVKDITATNTTTPTPTKTIKVGAKCKIKNGAKTYDNTKTFKSFVYTNTYDIISVNGDRVVFGIGTAVTGAIHKDNIILI